MAQQHLDHADVDLALQQMGGEAVAQRVRGHALVDAGRVGGVVDGAVELPRGQRVHRIQPGNSQPPGRILPWAWPTRHQARSRSQQHRAEHGVAVLAALALLDAQRHALAVDVADLERDRLRWRAGRRHRPPTAPPDA